MLNWGEKDDDDEEKIESFDGIKLETKEKTNFYSWLGWNSSIGIGIFSFFFDSAGKI